MPPAEPQPAAVRSVQKRSIGIQLNSATDFGSPLVCRATGRNLLESRMATTPMSARQKQSLCPTVH